MQAERQRSASSQDPPRYRDSSQGRGRPAWTGGRTPCGASRPWRRRGSSRRSCTACTAPDPGSPPWVDSNKTLMNELV